MAGLVLPVTEEVTQRVLSLPTGTAVGPEEVSLISQIIRTAVSYGAELSGQLTESGFALQI
jgi:hypothetical protein